MKAVAADNTELQDCYDLLATIHDPEIPVLSILDLGIVRDVELLRPLQDEGHIRVTITATYTGCPAMDTIALLIKMALLTKGYKKVEIATTIAPAWTTDWMSAAGKEKLKTYGIAPPDKRFEIPADGIVCPQCGSSHTRLLSEFGSTACKSLLQCNDCAEPFDYFKCH
ncbi:MAG: 1,2-phenylacetyl-CoA epoxidase subunit PaaD [Sphingomonadales bacterium]|nr:phenylacetate-CoA oxygenase subunit PaaJ [Sphingomonadales bacterium]